MMPPSLTRIAIRVAVATLVLAVGACSSDNSGPSVADGGLAVYVVDGPDDLETIDVAESLADVLELPDDVRVATNGPDQARIEGRNYTGVVSDRGAGSVTISYSGPRYSNAECIDCPLLDATDDTATAIDRSREILDAIGVDTSLVEFSEWLRTDDEYRIRGTVLIDGAPIDDLGFEFLWTHGQELARLAGGLFEVETIGTVAPRSEADARAQAETMIGSERTITDFSLTYIGALRDGELVVAPAYIATTDLSTTFTVPAFTGALPD